METAPVRKCPLCGSERIEILEPDAQQIRTGAAIALRCACGALITMNVLKGAVADPNQGKDTTQPGNRS
jgi:hypothetical protein